MGLMDKAKQALNGRSAMIEKGIDKAVTEANKRTNGKYGSQLTARAADLKERARKLDEARAAQGPGPAGHEPPGPSDPAGPVGGTDASTGGPIPPR